MRVHDIELRAHLASAAIAPRDLAPLHFLDGAVHTHEEDIEVGDPVHWRNDTGMGSEILTNLRSAQRFEVYFQNHWISKPNLRKQLLLE